MQGLLGVTCRRTVGNAYWERTNRKEGWKGEGGEGGKINSKRSFKVLTRDIFLS